MISYLIIGVTFAFAAAVQPGPYQSYLISQSLSKGWQQTIPAAFAPLISDGPIIVLAVVLLTRVSPGFIILLQFLGGFFLLYLAMKACKTWSSYKSDKSIQLQSNRYTLIQAAFVNLLNPAPYLGWSLVMGPTLIKGWRENPGNGIALLVGFYSFMIITSICIIILFTSAKKLGSRVTHVLIGISAIALGCFGLYQLWSGLKYFIYTSG